LLAAGFAPAQDQPDPGALEQQEPTYEEPGVLSRAGGFGLYVRDAGLYDFAAASIPPTSPDAEDSSYEGPSILSRATGLPSGAKGAINAFGLYAQILGVYDSGLVAPAAQGKTVAAGSYGTETSFGGNAVHRWKRGELSMVYRGAWLRYANAPEFNGLDQYLQLMLDQALLRHLTLSAQVTAGTTTIANGAFSFFPLGSLDRIGLPADELFDSRTNYMQSRVDLTWRRTARLSFDFGGDGFLVRRESPLLAGLNGFSARAGVAYRLTARQTISASYDQLEFDFQNAFGHSTLETGALGYSVALAREWDLATLAGAARVNTSGLTEVAVDPAIAALTGENYAVITFASLHYFPVAEIRLMRRLKEGTLTLDSASNITPGNGFYLTSRQTFGGLAYSYLFSRALEARWNAGFSRLAPIEQSLGKYSNLQGGIQALYRLTGDTYLDVRYDYRHYTTGDAWLKKDSSRVSLGVAFGLGETSEMRW